MAAKYFNFVDGQRLPGARVKEFLMNQAVIQCENQTEITSSGIEILGARVAINLEDGQLWTYTPDIEAWAPAQNTLDLDLLDARYYTKVAANGIFISEATADARYLTEVTARGIFLTATDASTTYYTKLQADGLFMTETTSDARYYTKLQADGLFITTTVGDARYITEARAGTLFISKGGAAGDINGNSTTIDGGKITTNTINVNRLIAGTLTGFRVQTSSSGQRVVMSEATNSLVFFNSGGTEIGRITGLSNFNYDTPSNHAFQVDGSTVFSVNGSGVSLAPGTSFNSNLSVSGNVTASGLVQSSGVTLGQSVTASGGVIAGTTVESGSTVIVGVMNTTGLAANVRHSSNGSALIRFTSDARIKDDIQSLDTGLDIINQLNPVTFQSLVDDDERRIPGFIAQDVEEVFPEDVFMVTQVPGLAPEGLEIPDIEENPLRSLEPTHFIPYLVKAVQELSAKNDALEARLTALEGGAQ